MTNESKYLAEIANPDHIDYDDALPAAELAASLAPDMARDAARWRMVVRGVTDLKIDTAAQDLCKQIEDEMGKDADPAEVMGILMDRLIERFGDSV